MLNSERAAHQILRELEASGLEWKTVGASGSGGLRRVAMLGGAVVLVAAVLIWLLRRLGSKRPAAGG